MTFSRRLDAGVSDELSRIALSALFLALAWRLYVDYLDTGRMTDLLLLIGELLVAVLTWLRRPARIVDRRAAVRLVTTASIMAPLLSRPSTLPPILSEDTASAWLALGLLIVVGGKMSLGCSFGLLPANRGVMRRGLYRIVRHPIYLGYVMTHIPFLAAHPSGWNAAVLIVGDTALIARALYEEQVLGRDPQYVEYCRAVKWRLVPGIC